LVVEVLIQCVRQVVGLFYDVLVVITYKERHDDFRVKLKEPFDKVAMLESLRTTFFF